MTPSEHKKKIAAAKVERDRAQTILDELEASRRVAVEGLARANEALRTAELAAKADTLSTNAREALLASKRTREQENLLIRMKLAHRYLGLTFKFNQLGQALRNHLFNYSGGVP